MTRPIGRPRIRPAAGVVHPHAAQVIALFGNAYALAEVLGRKAATVYRWTYPSDKGGTGGVIPGPAWTAIQEHAKAQGIGLPQPQEYLLT